MKTAFKHVKICARVHFFKGFSIIYPRNGIRFYFSEAVEIADHEYNVEKFESRIIEIKGDNGTLSQVTPRGFLKFPTRWIS